MIDSDSIRSAPATGCELEPNAPPENIHPWYTKLMVLSSFERESQGMRAPRADVNSRRDHKESPMKMLAAVVLSALVALPAFAQSREYQGPRLRAPDSTDQIIV